METCLEFQFVLDLSHDRRLINAFSSVSLRFPAWKKWVIIILTSGQYGMCSIRSSNSCFADRPRDLRVWRIPILTLQAPRHTFSFLPSSARAQMLKDPVFVGSWRIPELHFQRARGLFTKQKVN